MVQAVVIEVPETWDTIKHEKPIYPTRSRGMVGTALYCNNKYHCYSVQHAKPTYNLMPYRATGFGYAERAMKYVPLTHVQDRSKPKQKKIVNEKSEIKKIYEASMDEIKLNAELRNQHSIREAKEKVRALKETNCETHSRNVFGNLHHELQRLENKTEERIGKMHHRVLQMNRVINKCKYGINFLKINE